MNCLFCDQEIQGRKSRKFCHDAHKQAYWRKLQHLQAELDTVGDLEEARQRIEQLELQVSRLSPQIDIEMRYHQNHERIQELITLIEESNGAFGRMIIELHARKAMLPTLVVQINANESKLRRAIYALSQLKKEVGLECPSSCV